MTLGIVGLILIIGLFVLLYVGRALPAVVVAILLGVVIGTSGGPLGQMANAMVGGVRTGGNAIAQMIDNGSKG